MKIELKSLDLVHFKCFPKLHLDFHEGVNSLFGANAAGKTSVYDALTWLLFDKDSAGHSRPAIKPTGAPAGTMPEVTAVLEVDGEPIKLRKVLREKWEKPRGSSIERYAGDTRDYFIDDVPVAENKYKSRIAELIDEHIADDHHVVILRGFDDLGHALRVAARIHDELRAGSRLERIVNVLLEQLSVEAEGADGQRLAGEGLLLGDGAERQARDHEQGNKQGDKLFHDFSPPVSQ